MSVILLSRATVLTINQSNTVYPGGWILIEGGKIAGVGAAGSEPQTGGTDQCHDLAGHFVLPGFVNAHTHSPMILFRGRAEGRNLLSMEGWYNTIRVPELSMLPEDIGPSTTLSCAEMLLSGTTTFADQYFYAKEVADAIHLSGMRAVVTYGIVQLGDEQRGVTELQNAIQFIEQLKSREGRVAGWLGPHAPFVDNSEALLVAEAQAAQKLGVGLHLHMAVGPEDNVYTLETRGVTAAVSLRDIGFLDSRVLVAHCLDLSAQDIRAFSTAPALAVAHCAAAGLRSGVRHICPVIDLQRANVTVALGTDNVANNNSYDLLTEAKVAGLAASHRQGEPQPLSPTTLLRMATIQGARALGLDATIGSLEVGKSADVIAIDGRGPGYSDVPDPASLLIYSGSGRDVRHTWVDGEQLVNDGQLVRQNFAMLRKDFERAHERYWTRVSEASHQALATGRM
jgi:5-methylthioadenosine/S-adenosylhomocysteine deaminase